jgi:murein DD-endopeptidase MepM/ murein hydrolase activator NlpD
MSVSTAPTASAAAPRASPDRVKVNGTLTQGALLTAQIEGKVEKVFFPGHRVHVPESGIFPIAFGRNAPRSEVMVVHFADGSRLDYTFAIGPRTYEKDVIDGLPPDVVRLDPKEKREHDAMEARISAIRMKRSDSTCWSEPFAWPATGKVTSRYGQPRVLNGTDGGLHWGVDVAVPVGTRVTAPTCGTIVFVEKDVPLAGGTVVIDHGQGVFSSFIHLSAFDAKVGDEVKKGDVVARSGKTGRATGPHLHWNLNFFEVRVDPELMVPVMPGK